MEADGLTNDQTEKILQFQDLTAIEDINVCRDILIRHQWDLEVACQEQLNIREGRPTMFASRDIRPPVVINDRFLQQVFSASVASGRPLNRSSFDGGAPVPRTITGLIGFVINVVFQYCYTTLSSIISALFRRSDDRIVTDPLGDVMNFIRAYNDKYPVHPVFYQGTYAQALSDAKQELRFLLVYLHKEPAAAHTEVDAFCRQTLSQASVIDYINRNTLFWGCDVASPEGYRVAQSINARVYPVMVLIGLRANRLAIVGRFEGDCPADELLRRLRLVIQENDAWLDQARADRLERDFTQTLRRQQDEAYEQSLLADEEKERLRQLERDAERQVEEDKERERQEAVRKKEEIANLKIELADSIPAEPPSDSLSAISVVFKLPNGERLERRFHTTDSLSDLYNYLFCHPSSPDEFEITTNFPKRVLYSKAKVNTARIDASAVAGNYQTLSDVGLKNREVLFVNDLEA